MDNIVPVPKKDGRVRICVNFKDLNKVNLKDDFPLPHIDVLVNKTIGHALLSLIDRCARYKHIKLAEEDMEKATLIIPWVVYCYATMPFGLKNTGATYQRTTTTLLHDLMHKKAEVYMDDTIIKSKERVGHVSTL